MTALALCLTIRASFGSGAIAQLGERCNGIAEVGGSIPPSSTNLIGTANEFFDMKTIALLGQIVFFIGLFISVVGFVVGFWFMFNDNDVWAIRFLFSVGVGFMFMFTGMATSVMFSPRDDSELSKRRSLQDMDD